MQQILVSQSRNGFVLWQDIFKLSQSMIFFIKSYLRFTNDAVFRVPVPKFGLGTEAIIRYPATLDTRRSRSIHDTISLQ